MGQVKIFFALFVWYVWQVFWCASLYLVWYFFASLSLANERIPSHIDSEISQAVQMQIKFYDKKYFWWNRIENTVTAEKTSLKRYVVDVWRKYSYFKQQVCDYGIDKENMPENSIIHLNQGYQSWKDNKKV